MHSFWSNFLVIWNSNMLIPWWRLSSILNKETACTNNSLYCAKIHTTSQGCISTSARSHTHCLCMHKQQKSIQMLAETHYSYAWMTYTQSCTHTRQMVLTDNCRRLIHAYTCYTYNIAHAQDKLQLTGACTRLTHVRTHCRCIPTQAQITNSCW